MAKKNFQKKYRILITGSSGQIGTNLALKLLSLGHSVFGVDCRPNTWTDAFPTLLQDLAAPQHTFIGGIGPASYPESDLVVHLAANAKVHALVQEPSRALENIAVTFNVLEYCRHNHVPIVFSSSREVYGDIHRYITNETHANFSFTESPYSASKIAGEAFIYSYARCYNLPYIVFRFSNVYGRYDNDATRMERVIPLFIQKMKHREPVTVFGAKKILDFTYIDDCVDGIVAGIFGILENGITADTINLAYGKGNSLVTVAEYIAEALHIKPEIIVEKAKRAGEVSHYIANIKHAQEVLGYSPKVPLQEGIRKAVQWTKEWEADHDN